MNTEPTETHDRGAQEDTEKPDVGSLFDAPPRSEAAPLETSAGTTSIGVAERGPTWAS